MNETCKNCRFYRPDYGTWCVNGWTRDGRDGKCLLEPKPVYVQADQTCRHFESKAAQQR